MEKREVKKIENIDPEDLKKLNEKIFRDIKDVDLVEIEEQEPRIKK